MKPMHNNNMRRNNRHRSGGGNNSGGGNRGGSSGFRPYNRNQMFDSNGPDGRTRGTAQQVYEKYLQQARDAAASGDPVRAESLLQHAEHYFRILASFNEGQPGQQNIQRYDQYGDELDNQEGEQGPTGLGPQPAAPNYPQPYSVYAENAAPNPQQESQNGPRQRFADRWPRQQTGQPLAPQQQEDGQPLGQPVAQQPYAPQHNQNWGQARVEQTPAAPQHNQHRPDNPRPEPRNDPRRQRWEQQRQQSAAPVQADTNVELDDSLPAFLMGAPSILPVAPPMATNPVSPMSVALGEAPAESEATIAPDKPSLEAKAVAAIAESDVADKPKRRGRPARKME